MNSKKKITTAGVFLGLVCGLVLTQQQIYADTTATTETTVQNTPTNSTTDVNPVATTSDATTEVAANTSDSNVLSDSAANNSLQPSDINDANNSPALQAGSAATDSTSEQSESTAPATSVTITPDSNSISDNSPSSSELITSGTWGTSNWDFIHQGNDYTLTFHAGQIENRGTGIYDEVLGYDEYNNEVTEINFDQGVSVNDNLVYFFAYLPNLQKINGLNYLDTSNVTDMSYMFIQDRSLKNLDLSTFNTDKVDDMMGMFDNNISLQSLNLSSLKMNNLENYKFEYMFANDVNLSHLVLGSNLRFYNYYDNDMEAFSNADLPDVPVQGTPVAGTNLVVQSPYWIATSGSDQGTKYTSHELMNMPGRNQVTTYDWDTENPVPRDVEARAVTRTINLHQPDGSIQTQTQTGMIQRVVTKHDDGTTTYGDWSKVQWSEYDVPEIAGYQANVTQVPATDITADSMDQTVDIYYTPAEQTVTIQYVLAGQVVGTQKLTGYLGDVLNINYHAPAGYDIIDFPQATVTVDASGDQVLQVAVAKQTQMQTKTVVRTINIHYPSGIIKTQNQVVVLNRSVDLDVNTGQTVYGDWNTGKWAAVTVPTINGYQANQSKVDAQDVVTTDTNQIVDIYYLKN